MTTSFFPDFVQGMYGVGAFYQFTIVDPPAFVRRERLLRRNNRSGQILTILLNLGLPPGA